MLYGCKYRLEIWPSTFLLILYRKSIIEERSEKRYNFVATQYDTKDVVYHANNRKTNP